MAGRLRIGEIMKKGAVALRTTAPYNPSRSTCPVEGAQLRSPIARPFRLAAGRLTRRPATGGCQISHRAPLLPRHINTVNNVIVNKKIIAGCFLAEYLFCCVNETSGVAGKNRRTLPLCHIPSQLRRLPSLESLGGAAFGGFHGGAELVAPPGRTKGRTSRLGAPVAEHVQN